MLPAYAPAVAERLARAPGVQIVAGEGLDLYVRQGFLTAAECGRLIALIDVDRRPSTLLAIAPDPSFRTSESCDLDRWNPFVSALDRRIAAFLGLEDRQGETMQGQRYAVGQQFKAHYDWFDPAAPYAGDEVGRAGQRTWTAMIYLDEPAGGGETWFGTAQVGISPRTGMLLAWNNIGPDGPLASTLHESLPVTAGVKTIVTKWFRDRYWC